MSAGPFTTPPPTSTTEPANPGIDAHTTHDITGAWAFLEDRLVVDLGVFNIGDREPPQVYRQLNYDPLTHNPLGRIVQVGSACAALVFQDSAPVSVFIRDCNEQDKKHCQMHGRQWPSNPSLPSRPEGPPTTPLGRGL